MARITKKQVFQMPLNCGSQSMGHLEVKYIYNGPDKDIDLDEVKYFEYPHSLGDTIKWNMLQSTLFCSVLEDIYNAANEHAADSLIEEKEAA